MVYRGTSLIRKRLPAEPYGSPMSRALWRSLVGALSRERGVPVGFRALNARVVGVQYSVKFGALVLCIKPTSSLPVLQIRI